MRRCIELARQGELHVAPNPMVGAVVVHEGRIIGEGYHARFGEAHAEVNALAAVGEADRRLLPESTLYVSLEPCAHYGKTPPCADLIVRHRLRRVVVGCVDPFARVQGRGVEILRRAGIEVTVGVLEDGCRRLNRRFMVAQTLRRPYVTLKWAASADGFIDRLRTSDAVPPACISTPVSCLHGHRLRALHQAVLVGHRTLRLDRPRLNVRHWAGNDPLRIVLGHVRPEELLDGFRTADDAERLLADLAAQGVQSLLVEGGRQTLQHFIDKGLWDEAWSERGTVVLGEGVPEPRMAAGAICRAERILGADFLHFVRA